MVIAESNSESSSETEFARCECCGLNEEYTVAYTEILRHLYAGKLICGLCSEAVKYEVSRRSICVEEALAVHMRICGEFLASPSPPTVDFISAIGEMFRRRILNPPTRVVTSVSPSPVMEGGAICAAAVIGGIESCLPALSGGA